MDIKDKLEEMRKFYQTGKTKDVTWRIKQLRRLGMVIKRNEKEIFEALKKDLNKSSFETYATEIGMVLEELHHVIRNLNRWSSPKRVPTSIVNFRSSSYIYPEPYGVVLIMSPWNYPFQLAMEPLIGAIAAGNCIVMKPSNYSPNTSKVIEKIISETYFDHYVMVIQGGREANQTLLDHQFDYIFFTGGVTVGKTVMEAAAKHLTPVTLELGGKSPCIVERSADLNLAARRIVWGKFLNSGQTCVAPDYILVDRRIKEDLIRRMKEYILRFYGKEPLLNQDYPRIINKKHFDRLRGLLEGQHIAVGAQVSEAALTIAPTILDKAAWQDPVMQEEIFGPILPVLEYENLEEAIQMINQRPKPLAFYLFTTRSEVERKILRNISFGGGCINDTIMHLASTHMPFGGVGESGMGGYHGKASFDTFTHKKSILKKSNLIDLPLRYPPYKKKLFLLKLIMK